MSWENSVFRIAFGSIFGCLSLLTIVAFGQVVETQSNTQVNDARERVLQKTRELYSTLDANSLRPLTRQQFTLEVARAFFSVQAKKTPANLHHDVSDLTTEQALQLWLAEIWEQAGLGSWNSERAERLPDLICQTVVGNIVPQARFVTTKQRLVDKQLADNQYVGIGIRVRWDEGKAIIDEPFPGGAARQAGSVPGDCILEVNGRSMAGLDLGQIVDILRGPKGSQVNVVVENLDGSEPRSLAMVRTVVPIPSVQGLRQRDNGAWQFFTEQNPHHAYLRINQVVGSTSVELKQAAEAVVGQGLKHIVLDLQEMTDGDLHQLHMLADVLCGEGKFGSLELPAAPTQELMTRAETAFSDMHIAVLSPKKPVSGPVLGLLAMLKQRPETHIIGPRIVSLPTCQSSFDLSSQAGAIANLPYAWLVPDLQDVQPTGEASRELLGRIQFTPHSVADNPEEVNQLALAWLQQN
ncbi:MAG: PDZ domain-containing protein [Pirellulaceae bacterium]|nr:PDZ domain-containing protein [Pirellulaceae bacterium]MDG2104908.1 PDZ domain-containing protein [Pirellulaceae bacterium]